jgi:hypothetical protein
MMVFQRNRLTTASRFLALIWFGAYSGLVAALILIAL